MHIVLKTDDSYSPDVEIDEEGRVVYSRDIAAGETIAVPAHMFGKIAHSGTIYRFRRP